MINRRGFLKHAAVGGAALATGEAFAAPTVRGKVLADGKPLAEVVVSDGGNCTLTAADGTYELPGREGVRFIFVTIPSGWRTSRRYWKYEGAARTYDFELRPWALSKPGPFTIMHIGDSEIGLNLEKEKPWVQRAKAFADERNCAFFVHTGDICTTTGDRHLRLMNEDTVGRPVFYVHGNHDVTKPVYGEQVFEEVFGPCWYSFDCGGVHFIVTPMMWGDGKVSYTVDEIVAWMRNDLTIAAGKKSPVIHLVHGPYDSRVFNTERLFDHNEVTTSGADKFDLVKLCDYRAIIHGHLHANYYRRSAGNRISVISVAQPQKGYATLQVIHVDKEVKLTVENRYGAGKTWAPVAQPARQLWAASASGMVNCGAPCVDDGRVFVGTLDMEGKTPAGVSAFDARSGRKLWSFKTESDIKTRLLAGKGKVFVADIDWRIYALSAADGKLLWKQDLRREVGVIGEKLYGGADRELRTALTIDWPSNRIYCGTARHALRAVDLETGAIVWKAVDTRGQFLATGSCPVVCGETIVGGIFWDGLYGYDLKTGKRLWRQGRGPSHITSEWYRSGIPWIERVGFPKYHDGKLYIASHQHFFEVEPRTGKMLRSVKLDFCVICYHEPLILGNRAYFGSWDKGLVCVDMKDFKLLWTSPVEPADFCPVHYAIAPLKMLSSTPVLWKGKIWATAQDGAIYSWDPESGKRLERIELGVPFIASATAAGDRLYTVDVLGNVRAFQ